ncbi:MAG: DUF6569 family protein [Pyrinomonadaceae bacterium]
MKVRTLAIVVAVVSLAFALQMAWSAAAQVRTYNSPVKRTVTQAGEYKISGPYVYDNLAVFLIHGKDKLKDKTYLTLQEALQQKKVIVYETKDVNNLIVQNISKTEEIYIQAGDIVKGGQQDRVLGTDIVLPPRSGKINIAAFCVESSRWSQRGNESSGKFDSSNDRIATKELKLAATGSRNQSEVWAKVAEAQEKLSRNVAAPVQSKQSASSLQLTLENRKVQTTAENYVKNLSGIVAGKSDVIGYAFAINGHVNSADVYASNTLFVKLWPKLLKASAIEAIAELDGEQNMKPLTGADVKDSIMDAEDGKASDEDVTKRIKMVRRETDDNILVETRDRAQKEVWIHKSYIKKH